MTSSDGCSDDGCSSSPTGVRGCGAVRRAEQQHAALCGQRHGGGKVLEGGRVAVRLELQVRRRGCGDRLRVRGLLYISLPFLASPCAAATEGNTGWAFEGALQ